DADARHQPTQRAAIVLQIALLALPGGLTGQPEMSLHKAADALLHLDMLGFIEGVEGVIEVEHPGLDMAEIRPGPRLFCRRFGKAAHCCDHGRGPSPRQASQGSLYHLS